MLREIDNDRVYLDCCWCNYLLASPLNKPLSQDLTYDGLTVPLVTHNLIAFFQCVLFYYLECNFFTISLRSPHVST